MIAVKGLDNGKRIEFLEPLPKKQAQKKFLVVITFKERRELDKLVNEFEERTLQKTLALDAIRRTASRPNKKDTPKASNGR